MVADGRHLTAHAELQATEETAAKIIKLMSEALAQMSQSGIDRTGSSSSRSRRHKGGHHHALLAPHSKRKHQQHGRNSKHGGSNTSSSHSLLATLNQRLKNKSSSRRDRTQEVSASP